LRWVRSCIDWRVNIYVCCFVMFFYSLIISLFWCGHHGWVQGGGSWCLNFFRYPSQLDGVVGGHCQFFQHHFSKTIIGVSQKKVTIISTFLFHLIFSRPMSSFLFSHQSHLGDLSIIHSLEGTHRAIYLSNLFLHQPIFMSYNFILGFFLFVFVFPLLITFTPLAYPLSFLLVLNFIFYVCFYASCGSTLQVFNLFTL